MKNKNIVKSKTFWVNLIVVAGTLYPPVGVIVAAHPEGAVGILTLTNVLLRLISDGKVTLT